MERYITVSLTVEETEIINACINTLLAMGGQAGRDGWLLADRFDAAIADHEGGTMVDIRPARVVLN
jgi:hypothetical protein